MGIGTIRKVHTIRVCNGSGVIVRPLDKFFIYILTNYHVLFDNDGKIKDLKFKFANTNLKFKKQNFSRKVW